MPETPFNAMGKSLRGFQVLGDQGLLGFICRVRLIFGKFF